MSAEPRVGSGLSSRTPRIRTLVSRIGIGNLVIGVAASVIGVLIALLPEYDRGGPGEAILMVTVTLPALAARRAPAWAAAAQAAGALLNEIVIGPMVRCAVVLPVLFLILLHLGLFAGPDRFRVRGWGVVACAATALMELLWDPVLDSAAAIFIASVGAGFFFAGMLIRSRTALVAELHRNTVELTAQRDRTAAVEVAADRARVGWDLEKLIRSEIGAIAESAERAGTAARAGHDEEASRAALLDVEQSGRETLARMREVVGDLRDAPTDPPPRLDQLPELMQRATTADTRLRVEGPSRPLSANVELSAVRIVEQLLTTLRDHPRAGVDVVIRFLPDALTITVSGPPHHLDDAHLVLDTTMNAVRARAQLHGGTVSTSTPAGRRQTEVRLPLLAAAPR